MGKIHLLDENVINLIAAGEVVERPASIVKELMENSIDAGATEVIVKIVNGGLDEITIIDNGEGMDAEDAKNAFVQHATSKIKDADDLHNINSMGFRGEALASISSVSDIHLDTMTADTNPVGLRIISGKIEALNSNKKSRGTVLSIQNLFGNVPARRKFLRGIDTEFGHIQETFISIALAHLDIRFELHHQGKVAYELPVAKTFGERIFGIWNSTTAKNLYEAEAEINGIKLQMYLGSPEAGRKDRKLQYVFVNNRSISDRTLTKAVAEAYRGFLHKDLQPLYFVKISMPNDLVDVNVHPRKLEVRFQDPQMMYRTVYNAVRSVLEQKTKSSLMERIESANPPTFLSPRAQNDTPRTGGPFSREQQSFHTSFERPKVSTSLDFSRSLLQHERPLIEELAAETHTATDYIADTSSAINPVQVFATYIVYQQGEDVIFIDQHAAAEKIEYEKLMNDLEIKTTKPLLIPAIIDLLPFEHQKILENIVNLAEVGLVVADFGGNSIQVVSVPQNLPQIDYGAMLKEIVGELNEAPDKADLEHTLSHHIIATMACHGAIRAGQVLTQAQMVQVIQDLGKCVQPYNCPHGRPVSWVLTRTDLEKNFKRII